MLRRLIFLILAWPLCSYAQITASNQSFSNGFGTGSDGTITVTTSLGSSGDLSFLNETPPPGITELFISEYIEGSGNNKAIEIYNGTASPIALSGLYQLKLYVNGSPTPSIIISLNGTINPGDVFVVANNGADAAILAQADLIAPTNALTFNGNDAVVLTKSNVPVDHIGIAGNDPGQGWQVCSTVNGTVDHTIVRKSQIITGDANITAWNASCEWDVHPLNTFTYLGSHSITSTPNIAPSFVAGPNQTINEDFPPQTIANWATSIDKGAPDESAQILTFTTTNDNNALFSVQPSIDPISGTLTFTALPDAFGSALVTIILSDDGGTLNGGADTSAPQTFTITIQPVNDPPSFTKGPDQVVVQGAGIQEVVNWATAINSGPANESGQVVTFILTNNNNSLFITQPSINPEGTLTYTPSSTTVGSALIYVVLKDNGSTANGGVDTSIQSIFNITVQQAPATVVTSDSLALVALYNTTNGPGWTNKTNWLTGPVNTWHGVTVQSNRVTQLNLYSNQLAGALPPEIGNLAGLALLNLGFNQLTGNIPGEIGNLTNLTFLDFAINQLTGSIPATLGNLSSLQQLRLTGNQLTGPIPPQLGSLFNLYVLGLVNNQLTGGIPSELATLTQLQILGLSGNPLGGTIPSWIGDLTNLFQINLQNAGLAGEVPQSFTNLSALQVLMISGNSLTGLPDFSGISSLNNFIIGDNYFTFEDIEPNLNIPGINYIPQKRVPVSSATVSVPETNPLNLSVSVGGTANVYQWYKDGSPISGANTSFYEVTNCAPSDGGEYYLQITSTLVANLTLETDRIIVTILPPPDNDNDGVNVLTDCNDNDPAIYPGAPELCDGKDNDCDGQVDTGCASPQLWGLTSLGGAGGSGTIFSLHSDGSDIRVVHNFDLINGGNPMGALIHGNNDRLFGMTQQGGSASLGTIFSTNTNGMEYQVLHEFDGTSGASPYGSLMQLDNGLLYGMTTYGGTFNSGTIFRMNNEGGGFEVLTSFNGNNGRFPRGNILKGLDGLLYGMTHLGGSDDQGTIFKVNADGSGFAVLHNFINDTGIRPAGSLIQNSTGALFGMTQGGGLMGYGTIFKIDADGTNYMVLHHFDNATGSGPLGSLVYGADGKLYGVTYSGGSAGMGTLFNLSSDGTGYTVLYNFDGASGSNPICTLISHNNKIFGYTTTGGQYNSGVIFNYDLSLTAFTKLADLGQDIGQYPQYGSLLLVNPVNLQPPTIPATNIVFSNVTNNSMTISFTPGDGEKRVVLARESQIAAPAPGGAAPAAGGAAPARGAEPAQGGGAPAAPAAAPAAGSLTIADGIELSGNANFSLAPEYQDGWKVVYVGDASSVDVTNLLGYHNYTVTVIEYNGAGTGTRYLNKVAPVASQNTLADVVAPTLAASNITFTNVLPTEMTVSFNAGNGMKRLVVINPGSPVDFVPADVVTYTVGQTYGTNKIVSNNATTSVSITDLQPATAYHVTVYEYNEGGSLVRYLTAGAPVANQATALPPCDVPQNLALISATDNSLTVEWNNVTFALNYNIQYRIKGSTTWSLLSSSENSTTVNSLASGMQYDVRVQSACTTDGSLSSAWSSVSTFYTTGVPQCFTPQGLISANITDNGATVSWYAAQGALSYLVRHKTTAAWTEVPVTEPTISLSNLLSGTEYTFQVKSICTSDGSITSPWSGNLKFTTTGPMACGDPTLILWTVTDTQSNGDWDEVANALEYQVQRRPQGTSSWTNSYVPTSSIALTGLLTGTTYEARIRTICSVDRTVRSVFVTTTFTTTGPVTCSQPTGLQVTPSDTGADVIWDAAAGATEYNIRYRISGGSWQLLNVSVNQTTLTGLYSGTQYDFEVRTKCGTLTTPYSAITFSTTGALSCSAPVNLAVSNVSTNEADLIWTDNSVLHYGYEVNYKVKTGNVWTKEFTTELTHLLTGLQEGTQYQAKVKSICTSDGLLESAFSTTVNFTTAGSPSCSTPINAEAVVLNTSTVDLSWSDVGGALMYDVQYRLVGTSWTTIVAPTAAFTLSNLGLGEYQWRVRSVCTADKSVRSNWSGINWFNTETGESISSSTISLTLTPNPSSGVVNINFVVPQTDNVVVRVQQLGGPVVYQTTSASFTGGTWNSVVWDGTGSTPGIYIVRIMSSSFGNKSARVEIMN